MNHTDRLKATPGQILMERTIPGSDWHHQTDETKARWETHADAVAGSIADDLRASQRRIAELEAQLAARPVAVLPDLTAEDWAQIPGGREYVYGVRHGYALASKLLHSVPPERVLGEGEEKRAPDCEWHREDSEDPWSTGCGTEWALIDGMSPEECGNIYCGNCGGKIALRASKGADA